MAKSPIPKPLDRRHLIEREISEAQSLKVAEAYLAEGRDIESLEFLRKAGAEERLTELRAQAVKDGDVFLLRSVAAVQGEDPDRDEWGATADAATAAGLDRYAAMARRQADRGD